MVTIIIHDHSENMSQPIEPQLRIQSRYVSLSTLSSCDRWNRLLECMRANNPLNLGYPPETLATHSRFFRPGGGKLRTTPPKWMTILSRPPNVDVSLEPVITASRVSDAATAKNHVHIVPIIERSVRTMRHIRVEKPMRDHHQKKRISCLLGCRVRRI